MAIHHKQTREFLKTGRHDPIFSAWPGNTIFERCSIGSNELISALVAEVIRRTDCRPEPPVSTAMNAQLLPRDKFRSMVAGLFPGAERETVLSTLDRSVVFLTRENISTVLREMSMLSSAWDLANLYLGSCEVGLLSGEASQLLGLSIEATCYVSTDYFRTKERFADYVVHEAAHVFHNCKRETLGLPFSRRREWLLDIDYRQRETFAYSCEAYSRILELGRDRKERQALLEELTQEPLPGDERVDGAEYLDILGEAVAARNGWKRILDRCAPKKAMTRHQPLTS